MSVSDLPRIFREEKTVLLLFPSVGHGYLFHITGDWWFILLGVLGLISPAYDFSIYYYHQIGAAISKYEGWMIERVSIITVFLYLTLAVSHLALIAGLIWHMDHTDYILVYLFLAAVFLPLVEIFSGQLYKFAEHVQEIEEQSQSTNKDE